MTPDLTPSRSADAARARLLAARDRHWRRTRSMTVALLALWMLTGFGTVFYARELAEFSLFGWPLSFYMAAQGASLVSLAIIGLYAWWMRVLERRYARALKEGA